MVAALVLVTVSGCCESGITEPQEIEFEPQAELRAIASNDVSTYSVEQPRYYLADAAGGVTMVEEVYVVRDFVFLATNTFEVSHRPLVDVAVRGDGYDLEVWVVDEAATVHASLDSGWNWTSHPHEVELEPRGLVLHRDLDVIIYGDEFVRTLYYDKWSDLPAPDGGWGPLRAGTALWDVVVLTDGESLLLADGDPMQFSWQRLEVPTEVLVFGGDFDADLHIGGRNGLVLETRAEHLGPDSTWTEIQLPTEADIVAIEGNVALTNAGELFHLDTLAMLDVGDANVGMAYSRRDFVMFGANGPLLTNHYEHCDNGPL